MPPQLLTPNDSSVLYHIFDPESVPSAASTILIDASLPADPHIRDPYLLKSLQRHEQQIIASIELPPIPQLPPHPQPHLPLPHTIFETAYTAFTILIRTHPSYASAHNNRAQLIRLRYGNAILIQPRLQPQPQPQPHSPPPTPAPRTADLLQHAHTTLTDLNRAIALLTPFPLNPNPTSPAPTTTISPLQRKTLAQAHTQRAALFHAAAKTLSSLAAAATLSPLVAAAPTTTEPELIFTAPGFESWSATDFEEAASRDFGTAGGYGSEMGRVLGVAVNPTAKLCGEMVRGAMWREVRGGVGVGGGGGGCVGGLGVGGEGC